MTLTATDIRTRAAAALAARRSAEAAEAEAAYQAQLAEQAATFAAQVDHLIAALAAFGLACPREKVVWSVFAAFNGAMVGHGDLTYFWHDRAFWIGTRCDGCQQWTLSNSLEPGDWAALGEALEAEEACECPFAYPAAA